MSNNKWKINFITFFVIVAFGGAILRLVYLQFYKHEYYAALRANQSFKKITVYTKRGDVLDSKNRPLTENYYVASVFVSGLNRSEAKKISYKLRKLGIRKNIQPKKFQWVVRNTELKFANRLKQISPSIDFIVSKHRFYPYAGTFSQIIGFTGVDDQGLMGIEAIYNKELEGLKKEITLLRDSKGRFIFNTNFYLDNEEDRSRVILTIDKDIQRMVETVLLQDLESFGAKKGVVLIMDVENGEIVASVSKPDFNPNRFLGYGRDRWKNYATQFTFEPGSIFKPITFAYLLTGKKLHLDKKIDCENGSYKKYGHFFNDVHKFKVIPVREVLIHSSNIGTVKLMEEEQEEKFYRFITKVGFGRKTGIFGAVEEAGLVRPYKKWSKLSKYSIAIGQEIFVTPIQMVRFYAAIANGGYLVTPTYIKYFVINGKEKRIVTKKEKVLNDLTAFKLKKLLRKVVLEGTGVNADSEIVKIAGKTGTAQKFDRTKNRYSHKDYIASFAGFFPFENPKYAMIVIYDSPKKSIYGGSTAAITFKKIAELLTIFHDRKIKIYRVMDESRKAA